MIDLKLTVGAALIAVAVFVIVRLFTKRRTRSEFIYLKKPLLTNNEKEFYGRIKKAIPEFTVFTQVSMGALMNGKHVSGNHIRTRAKFAQKIVDFVITDDNCEVLLLIELDDRMHDKAKDRHRDSMTRAAGYTTLRFESRAKPSVSQLRTAILRGIHASSKQR